MFYHLLVDVRDWPQDDEQPPVAYVGEDKLGAASSADFSLNTPLNVRGREWLAGATCGGVGTFSERREGL